MRQEVNRFEETGLPRTIRSNDACRTRIEVDTGILQAAEILDPYGRQQEISARLPCYRRIGITTYFASGMEAEVIRQLLLESVSPISTIVPSKAASASSK